MRRGASLPVVVGVLLALAVSRGLAEEVVEVWRGDGFPTPCCVSVNSADGSCWVADYGSSQMVHLSATGVELWRGGGLSYSPSWVGPNGISANSADGSCWVADWGNNQVVHLSSAGGELWRGGGFSGPCSVSVNSADGSCWVADRENNQVAHLSSVGAELWRGGECSRPISVSVNSADGSCWVADWGNNEVVHLSASGGELSRTGGFFRPVSVSVDLSDGSCWAADHGPNRVVHLAANGSELWSGTGFAGPCSASVNSADGSCWVVCSHSGEVVHVLPNGQELWRGTGFLLPESGSMDPADGSCWVVDGGHAQIVKLAPTEYTIRRNSTCLSRFECSTSPLSSFSSGPGYVTTSRCALTGTPSATSGNYAVSSGAIGQGITGLRLALPAEPTGPIEVGVRAWAYVAERTEGDSSTFFGFAFGGEYPSSAVGWNGTLGWEALSDTASQFRLVDATEPTGAGLPEAGWHLVELRYVRAANHLTLWLDGQETGTANAPGAGGRIPSYVVLGVLGEADGAAQRAYFDDVLVTLVSYCGPPRVNRAFSLLEGQEQVAEGQQVTCTLAYGNGYPMLGTKEVTETLPQTMYAGLSLPEGYSLVSADPAPSRTGEGTVVWALDLPVMQQAGYIQVALQTPTGLATATDDRAWAWGTTDAGAATVDPPAPPHWADPTDPVWGAPQDVLPQHIELEPKSDVWVRKLGPRFTWAGDIVVYGLTVGNSGFAAAEDAVVRDLMPELLGGGNRIVANLAQLPVGETWSGIVSAALPWGVPGGTVLLNRADVSTGAPEVSYENNTSEWEITTRAARDPNAISVSPTGGVDRAQQLTYTLECENTGAGTAYGVYATATLDPQLNGTTLLVSDRTAMSYSAADRALVWEVGTLGPGEGASTTFTVLVDSKARRARPVIGQAVVYFPSVPEITPTNIVFNIVNGTFSDVGWDHWALLPVEQTFENGIVQGYPDGTYRPSNVVDRGQMAVYMARALADGDAHVPTGPAEPTFSDVLTDHWAYKYVEYACDQNVVVGYPDGTYRPDNPVDRGQMAVYVARAMVAPAGDEGIPDPPTEPTFSDVTGANEWSWCYPHVEYVASEGVVGGYADGTYRPAVTVTRDQMAVYVTRAFRLPM